MKNLFVFLFVVSILLCLAACGGAEEEAIPRVSLTDIAAEAVPAGEIVPADVNEVAVATEEMILGQPMEFPMEQPVAPASGEASAEAAEEEPASTKDE